MTLYEKLRIAFTLDKRRKAPARYLLSPSTMEDMCPYL